MYIQLIIDIQTKVLDVDICLETDYLLAWAMCVYIVMNMYDVYVTDRMNIPVRSVRPKLYRPNEFRAEYKQLDQIYEQQKLSDFY